jgi:hypothetical protein
MNCAEFRDQLHSSIERRRPVNAAAETHLQHCDDAACRRAWREALLLDGAIAEWRRVQPTIHVADRVVAEWRAFADRPAKPSLGSESAPHRANGRAVRQSRRRSLERGTVPTGAWLAGAVATVLCVTTLALVSSTPRPPDSVALTTQQGTLHVNQDGAADPILVAHSDPALQDIGRSYVGLMQNATFAVTDVVVLTLGGDEQLEEPSPAARWVHRWRDELDPVRDDFDDAVEKILRTIPDSFPST